MGRSQSSGVEMPARPDSARQVNNATTLAGDTSECLPDEEEDGTADTRSPDAPPEREFLIPHAPVEPPSEPLRERNAQIGMSRSQWEAAIDEKWRLEQEEEQFVAGLRQMFDDAV